MFGMCSFCLTREPHWFGLKFKKTKSRTERNLFIKAEVDNKATEAIAERKK